MQTVQAQPFQHSQLPEGNTFPFWEDVTEYGKVYHVNQNHPLASDENPGSMQAPFATIGQAAKVLKPGEKVLIHSGTYRERITPERGGKSASEMIAYEAAAGAEVIVKGSKVFEGNWEHSLTSNGRIGSYQVWQTDISEFFGEGRHPFNTANASDADIEVMPWAEDWKGMVPYSLLSGMVFQDGKRLLQLSHYEDLYKVDGAFWVDSEKGVLHLNPFGQSKPGQSLIELTDQLHVLKPENMGLSYLKIKGLTFEQVGTTFPRIGSGAIFVNGGHHWIIEENTVRHINSVGIETGADVKERKVASKAETDIRKENKGGFIVRDNHIYDCGTGGIQGHGVRNSLIEGNHISHIGWQDAEYYWECAAIKLLLNRQTLVRKNIIHDVMAACGVWLDWDTRNSRITQNIVFDVLPSSGGALYVEASQTRNLIDHNTLWNIQADAISTFDSDSVWVVHNLIGKCKTPWHSKVNTDRKINGRLATSKQNYFAFNLLYHNEQLPIIEHEGNRSDHNLFVGDSLSAWQEKGWGKNSRTATLSILFDRAGQQLYFEGEGLPVWQEESPLRQDYHGYPRQGGNCLPGPFAVPFSQSAKFSW